MDAAGPKPCAAMRGTTILVEDLFYNSLTRKKVGLTDTPCCLEPSSTDNLTKLRGSGAAGLTGLC